MAEKGKTNKIGTITTPFFRDNNYTDGFRKIKNAGFDCVDFQGLFDVNNELYKMDYRQFRKYLTEIRQAADGADIEISQVHGPWPVDDTTKESREAFFEYTCRAAEAAALLGAQYIVVHPKMPFGGIDTGHESETYDCNVEFLKRITPFIRQNGITLCVENMPFISMSMSSVYQISEMLDAVNEDCFGICLDTGHSAILHENVADILKQHKSKIKALHVHDNDGVSDSHTWPLFGCIDWLEFSKIFVQTDIVLSSEAYSPFRFGQMSELLYDETWRLLVAILKNIAGG